MEKTKIIKRFTFGIIFFLLTFLLATNPSFNDFEKYAYEGMGSNFTDKESEILNRKFFDKIGLEKIVHRNNYVFLSSYEIKSSFINSVVTSFENNNPFVIDISKEQALYFGIAGSFYPVGNTAGVINAIFGFFELCRIAVINCDNFFKKYNF